MYSPAVTEESIAGTGFTLADYEDDICEVWPENQEAFSLFSMCQTQWRTGMNGPTGLDYNVLFTFMNLKHLNDERKSELLEDIRVMESAALSEIHRKKD